MPGQEVAIVGVRITVKGSKLYLELQWTFILQFLSQVKVTFPNGDQKTQLLFCSTYEHHFRRISCVYYVHTGRTVIFGTLRPQQ